jgi:hypothetical protein
MFTAPWTFRHSYELKPDWYLQDYNCRENDRHAVDGQGNEAIRLQPQE